MKKFIYSFILIIFILVAERAGAQYNLGVATGDWASTSSLYLNPANIAERGEKIAIDVFSINAGVDNNLGHLASQGGIIGAINSGNTTNMFAYDNTNSFSLLAPYAEVHGPGIIVAITRKHSIGLTSRIRGFNQFDNFSRSLYQTISNPSQLATGNVNLTSKNFNYTAHLWSEIGLTYGGVILEQGVHKVKVGATLRYLGGIGYIGMKGNNLNVQYKQGSDTLRATNSDIEFASNLLSTQNALLNGLSNNSILSEFFGTKSGMGIGGDLGLIYEFTPASYHGWSTSPNGNYLVRVSASVVDLGAITYNSSNNSNAELTGNGYITGQGIIDNIGNFNNFKSYAIKQGFNADTAHQNTKVYMPGTFRFGADVNAWWHFYVNATYIANIENRSNFGNSYYNQFTLTPRFDSRLFSLGIPVTYDMLTQSWKMGFGFRISGFFVGSDDMLALFAPNQYGFNFYAGGYVPIGRNKAKEKDRDGDGVPDSKDKCPDEYGPKENNGCPYEEPDNEHGGSPDSSDNCPDIYISPKNSSALLQNIPASATPFNEKEKSAAKKELGLFKQD